MCETPPPGLPVTRGPHAPSQGCPPTSPRPSRNSGEAVTFCVSDVRCRLSLKRTSPWPDSPVGLARGSGLADVARCRTTRPDDLPSSRAREINTSPASYHATRSGRGAALPADTRIGGIWVAAGDVANCSALATSDRRPWWPPLSRLAAASVRVGTFQQSDEPWADEGSIGAG